MTSANFIGNKVSAKGDVTYKTFNPLSNTENEPAFVEASKEEIEEAVVLASKAFEEFRKLPGAKRASFLNSIAEEILELGEELIQRYCAETGLPEARAKGERNRTTGQLRAFAALLEEGSWVEASIDTAQPERIPVPKPDLRKMMIPLGPVVVFGASNFPLAYSTAGGDTAAALAAGCPVIVKSHPMHAGTGALVASAIAKAAKKTAMPNGVFSNLNSKGIEVGEILVKHPLIKAVGFTGSIRGGRALFNMAAQREEPIPVFAEMGSINPVVLLPEALIKKGGEWAKTYAASITLGTGQFCTNPGLILGLESEALTAFTLSLSKAILEKTPSVMLHPNIYEAYDRNSMEVAQEEGTQRIAYYKGELQQNFARQTVLSVSGAEFLQNTRLHQEVFGPFSLVVRCADIQELEAVISGLEGQLTGTIIGETEELPKYSKLIDKLQNRVGRLIYNGVPTGVEVCPSMQHGGPYPASTDSRFTAVGIHSIKRWMRPVSYQDWPDELLPEELRNENPLGINRLVNGVSTREKL